MPRVAQELAELPLALHALASHCVQQLSSHTSKALRSQKTRLVQSWNNSKIKLRTYVHTDTTKRNAHTITRHDLLPLEVHSCLANSANFERAHLRTPP
jgi:hypothetical protein